MLKFISFGSGSSGNCYYLSTGDDALLIDAGVGVRLLKKEIKDYGVTLSSIHNILITHDHADHVKSVGSLSHTCGAPVWATEKVHEGIGRNYCVRFKVAPEFRRIVEKGVPFQAGAFEVTAFGVPHDSLDNVGYCIHAGGVTFCIMTDVGHVTDEMKPYIAAANYLVIEANHDEEMLMSGNYPEHLKRRILSATGHLSNHNSAVAIAENATEGLRHVWLCHLSEENNHPELARITVEETLRTYGIVVGKEFQLDVLKRKMPSGPWDLT